MNYTILGVNEDNEVLTVEVPAYSSHMALLSFANQIHEYGWHITDVLDVRVLKIGRENNNRDLEVRHAALELTN